MATFQSRVEVKKACEKLLELEEESHRLIQSAEDLPLDQIEKLIDKQSKLINEIEFEPEAEDELPEDIARPVKKFVELREKNKNEIEDFMEQIDKRMDSLEQSNKLMRHYMQGGRRDEESASARIDEDV